MPPLQAEYGEDASSGVSSPMSGAGVWQIENGNQPELIVIEPEEGGDGEKKFKCSFCPNKIFKKKPEVLHKTLFGYGLNSDKHGLI